MCSLMVSWRAVALAVLPFAVGCTVQVGAPEQASQTAQRIVAGRPAPADAPTLALNGCGAFLVAPNLMVTARHCVTANTSSENGYWDCDPRDYTEAHYGQLTLPAITIKRKTSDTAVLAKAVKGFIPTDISSCTGGDIAFILLDRAITNVPILPIRLSQDRDPLVPGEMVTLYGSGMTGVKGQYPKQLLERDTPLLMVGPGFYKQDPYPTMIVTNEDLLLGPGACPRDSGNPAIRKSTGAVLGPIIGADDLNRLHISEISVLDPSPYCNTQTGLTYVARLTAYPSLVKQAFAAAGYSAWAEGRDPPKNMGETCEIAEDCKSGICATDGDVSFCTQSCADQACPKGFDCAFGKTGEKLCVPSAAGPVTASSGGCAVDAQGPTGGAHQSWLWLAAVSIGLDAAARRRRRRRQSS